MPESSSPQILSVAVPRPVDGLFTYRVPDELLPKITVGGWVKVPFGRSTTHAFVIEPPKTISELSSSLSPDAIKDILAAGEDGPIFTPDVIALCKWAHDYYRAPLGEVLHCAAPPAAMGLRTAKREARPLKWEAPADVFRPELTSDQKEALQKIESLRTAAPGSAPKVALLHGVTGSGKTEVYLELARRTLSEKKSVLLLVPEIALTPQLHQRLESGLGTQVGLWHSAVSDAKRRDQAAALRRGELRVVVGARSAVFAPLQELGLIVIDEEHDATYKQEERFRYHARDLAVVRAKLTGATVVLGSATPSLESRERVRDGKYELARLPRRIGGAGMPAIEIVDLREEERVLESQAPLARKTIEAIRETIAAGNQAMVFLNRRGFAAFLVCEDCGEVTGCPNCSISLTVHMSRRQLRCHVCDHQERIPDSCPKCQGTALQPLGAGTESLETDLPKLIEGLVPLRLDRDQVTSATRLGAILEDFRARKANVLLGTQMLVKGHDFPGVTLVVVVLADALFRWPDFRAAERACQILTQVAGRAGRAEQAGRVLIQTFNPEHPVIEVLRGNLQEETFLESEREIRKELGYPPFARLARLRFEDAAGDQARSRAVSAAAAMRALRDEGKIEVLGPSEAFLERAKGIYRWDLLVKSRDIQGLQKAVSLAKNLAAAEKWPLLVDIDPQSL